MDQKITFVVPQGMDVTITVSDSRYRGPVNVGAGFPAGYFSEDPERAETAHKLFAEDEKPPREG